MKRHVYAIAILLVLVGVAPAAKKYKLTIGDQVIEVQLEEIPEPTPAPPEPEPLPEPDPEPEPAPDPEPDPSSPANIAALNAEGWDVRPLKLMPHPSPEEIKAALIPPAVNDGRVVVKRLWIPRQLASGNYDAYAYTECNKTMNAMHRHAMRAWYELQVKGNQAGFDTAMASAKSLFHTHIDNQLTLGKGFPGFLVISSRSRDAMTAILALDWIQWDSAEEFEAAFAKVRKLLEWRLKAEEDSGANFRDMPKPLQYGGDGYFHATTAGQSHFYLEPLLAFVAYGINPESTSHAWADDIINRMGRNPYRDPTAVYSPWIMHQACDLISLGNGGGREWGANANGPGMGGYEPNFTYAAVIQFRSVDTATNNRWGLVDNSQYLQTRHIGLCVMEDRSVEKTDWDSNALGLVEVLSRLAKPDAAGRYSWVTARTAIHKRQVLELQALAGVKAAPIAPVGSFAGRIGSRWYYKENVAQPDSSFRLYQHYRSLNIHRETGADRVGGVAIGSVGLVSGHCNRASPQEAIANGIWYGTPSSLGNPIISGNGSFWSQQCTSSLYHSPLREGAWPESVASDPRFLEGTQDYPVFADGVYTWTRDWTQTSNLPLAKTNYRLDTAAKTLTIEDEIACDRQYVGWHFSPSHEPVLTESGFEFGDGINSIHVSISANVPLTPTVRHSWELDGYTLPLEWHETGNGGRLKRIAANVGFTPAERPEVLKVKTTIEAK